MTMTTAEVRPLPGSGLAARAGDLLLVCADGGTEVDALLTLVAEVAATGGDGGLLVRRVAALLAADFDGRFPACAVSGPTRDGRLAVLVHGAATVDLVTTDGNVSLAGADAITSVNRLISSAVSLVRLRLPGAGEPDPRSRLDSGVVRAGGLLRVAATGSSIVDSLPSAGLDQPLDQSRDQPEPTEQPRSVQLELVYPAQPAVVPEQVSAAGRGEASAAAAPEPAAPDRAAAMEHADSEQVTEPARSSGPDPVGAAADAVQSGHDAEVAHAAGPALDAEPAVAEAERSAEPEQIDEAARVSESDDPTELVVAAVPAVVAGPVVATAAVKSALAVTPSSASAAPVAVEEPVGPAVPDEEAAAPPPAAPPPAAPPPAEPAVAEPVLAETPDRQARPETTPAVPAPRPELVAGVIAVPDEVVVDASRLRQPDPAAPFVALVLSPDADSAAPAAMEEPSTVDLRPVVLGVLCSTGHFTNPTQARCIVCGISMEQQTLVMHERPRPPLGLLLLDDGLAVRLDMDYVVGREPQADPEVIAGSVRPLRITDVEGVVSRRHLRVALVGWDVQVMDLGSANGTSVGVFGDPQRQQLAPNQPVLIRPGAQITMGRRWLRYESYRVS